MNKSQKQALGVGAALAATAAAAAGAYFFAGKQGAKHRKQVSDWSKKAQAELMKQVKSMEKVTKANYHKAVDMVSQQAGAIKNVDKAEVLALAKELKGNWDKISKEIEKAAKSVVPKTTAKKPTVKKAPTKKPAAKKK